MTAKLFILILLSVLASCGEQLVEVEVGVGEATIDNAAAAVVVLEGDRFEADEQVRAITSLEDGTERPPPPENLRLTSVQTEGEPSGRFYVQFIFQSAATVEDRGVIADRVEALGLDEPIWLGPDDRWPFCREQPCILVSEDGGFPN